VTAVRIEKERARCWHSGIPHNVPVLSEKGGTLVFKDMIAGRDRET
jgi:hypothetical protein